MSKSKSPPRDHEISRRTLMQSATAGGALAALGSAGILGSLPAATAAAPAELPPVGGTILFQGDSITDGGRKKKDPAANHAASLGRGYPVMLAGALLGTHHGRSWQIHNRGISGNKVPDLARRWQADAIDMKPALLSILVGVNDIWHKLNGKFEGTVADYEKGYGDLLDITLEKVPGVKIVVCEPFVLRTGAVSERWFPEFDERRAAAKRVAETRKLTFVPFQTMFDDAVKSAPASFWAGDGVHPSLAGHALMAATWRRVVGLE